MAMQTKDFSASGFLISGQGGYTYTLRVMENSIDQGSNSSNVTVQAILRQNTAGPGFSDRSVGFSCTVNGATVFSYVTNLTVRDDRENILYTWNQQIPHEADGSLTLRISGRLWSEGVTLTVREGEMPLTPTPRASTVRAVDAAIGSTCAVAIMAVSDAFTHTVAYRFGTRTGYLTADGGSAQNPQHLPGGMLYWTVPESFYDQIPNKKWDTCILTCTTYYNGAQLGAPQQTGFLVSASEAVCKPSLSATISVIDEKTRTLTGGSALIRYHSTLRCIPHAWAVNSAVIVETRVNGSLVSGSYLDIPEADTDTYLFTTRDSRGWEAEQRCYIPVIPYEKPTVRISAQRVEPGSTDVIVQASGTFYVRDFGLKQNTVTLRYALDGRNPVSVPVEVHDDGTFSGTFQAEDVDYSKATRLTVTVEDLVTEADARIWVQAGEPVFCWDRDRFSFRVPVDMASSVSGLFIRQGSRLQSRFDSWGEGGDHQPVWLFGLADGQPVQGVLLVGSDGSLNWSGAPQLEFTAGKDGQVTLPVRLTCLSPEPMDMEE